MRSRALAGVSCVVVALVAAGCGGGSKHARKTTTPHATHPAKSTAFLGGDPSAGQTTSYVPSGKIVVDSGFRPPVNGFGFENYGNDAGPVNLTPANVIDIFGDEVCAAGSGATCVLTPSARHWMEEENQRMAGGHCMGFSVTALRFYTKNLLPSAYGANRTIDLPVQGNVKLQSLIAEDWTYQNLPSVVDRIVSGTPDEVLRALIDALRTRKETFTLGILKADGTGGHAITPFAVEDHGGGQARILVYDNNFPGVVRALDVDTNADTWHYVGGINPSDTNEIYDGDARTKSMVLIPTSPGEGQQPCPFCQARHPSRHSAVDKLHYIEVSVTGKGAEHPHLLLVDPQGRETGFANGKLVEQIPGVQVVQNYSVQNWNASAEPTYRLPLGHPTYKVTVDGSSLKKAIQTQIQVNGNGLVFYVRNILMAPGQKDSMLLIQKDLALSYTTGAKTPASPSLFVQFPQFDKKNSRAGAVKARLVTMGAGWTGFAPGSPVTLVLRPIDGTADIISSGDKPLAPSARYVMYLDSSPLNGGLPERTYATRQLAMDPGRDELARWHYLRVQSRNLPVDITDPSGRRLRRELVPGR